MDNGCLETRLPTPLRLLPPSSRALPLSDHSQKGGGVRADPRGNFQPPEEGSSRSSELSFPWVLLALISCAKETRRLAPHHQSQSLEQISITDALQDGVQCVSDSSPSGRGFHDIDRPSGRLLSNPHSSSVQKISSICVRGDNISVQEPVLRPSHSPTGLHESLCPDIRMGPCQGHKTSEVFRRLANSSIVSSGV